MLKLKRLFIIVTLIFVVFISFNLLDANKLSASASSNLEYVKGEVTTVSPLDTSIKNNASMEPIQGEFVTIRLTSGPETGKIVAAINYTSERSIYNFQVKPGDKVIVAVTGDFGITQYHISDFDRIDYVYILAGIFILSLVILGGLVGVKSLFALAFSIVVIFKFFIDQVILNNINLALLTLLVATIVTLVTQVTISGFSKKALAAVLGTIGGVIAAGALSMLSIHIMHLTGLDSEEAIMLKAIRLSYIDFQGVLFAGMVFGALGAVMDVSISIASAVHELKRFQPDISFKEMVQAGMNVGRDIMGTMSNTLILAYSGSSLPLMLLITSQKDISMLKIMNLGLVVTEMVRALTGSIGLILAIPLTALISAALFSREAEK